MEKTQLVFTTKDVIELGEGTKFKIFKKGKIELFEGVFKVLSASGENLEIKCVEFTLDSQGSPVAIDRTDDTTIVTSGNGTVLTPLRWRPNHFWPFESQSDRAIDMAGKAHGIPDSGATKTQGLVGQRAYDFDNSLEALINVGSGGGTVPATGTFAVTDGVTIEALIVPKYLGHLNEVDEIFRKDQADRELRMLLSFQHDKGKRTLFPPGDVAESLSFGLYLVGQGYHELKLALDGKEGRPSLSDLKDGTMHHIVATYNVRTGVKAIYIDGVRHAYVKYPPGSRMLSGGSGMANIGNSPNNAGEAFYGVIDEVAFYDFALPQFMIEKHKNFAENGKNYYGLSPSSKPLPEVMKMVLPDQTTIIIDSVTGLPQEIK